MKAQGLTKKQVVSNPGTIEPPTYKLGILSKKTLNLREIEAEIKSTQDKIQEYSKKLEPGSEAGLFIGVAVVVVRTQADQNFMIRNNSGGCCSDTFSICCPDKNKMTFERAPEPSDVYWENLNITTC